jgi:hypothetical protein
LTTQLVKVMKVQRRENTLKSKILQKYKTIFVWSSDGWTYDTHQKTRRKFFNSNKDIIIEEEKLDSIVISGNEYMEEVEIILFSEKPRIWREKGDNFEETFEETI